MLIRLSSPNIGPPIGDRRLRLMDPIGGTVVHLPYLPEEIETSGLAQQWTQLNRPGRKPLLQATGKGLRVVTMSARLTVPGQEEHVDGHIDRLKALAASNNPIRVNLSGQYLGLYRITALTVRETMWGRQGKPRDADVDIELTQSSDQVAAVGPIKRKNRWAKRGDKRGRRKRGYGDS